MRTLLCLMLMLLPLCGARSIMRDPFEGNWKVRLNPDEDARRAGGRAFDDTLTFKAAKFESAFFKARGFKPAEYEQDTRGISTAKFTVHAGNDKGETATWEGSITSSDMSGSLVWTKDGEKQNFVFQGSR